VKYEVRVVRAAEKEVSLMWEYTFVQEGDPKKLVEKMNELGKEGWEAIAYATLTWGGFKGQHVMFLKRQTK